MADNQQITRTRTLTGERELQKALRQARLTREEELVLRMRLGIPEAPSAKLEFMGTDDPELAAKLAMIEAQALETMRPRPVSTTPNDDALKRSIIEKLKEL